MLMSTVHMLFFLMFINIVYNFLRTKEILFMEKITLPCYINSFNILLIAANMKSYQTLFIISSIIALYLSFTFGKSLKKLAKGKICIGTNGRMSVPSNREHHYKNLRDRYTNCTYVDGNLELTWISDENVDLSFLSEIREVTGYVLISHVDVKRIVLKKLMIIRGRNLFKLNVRTEYFALMVTLSKMDSLELPSLRDILSGSIGFYNNYNLCFIKTIKWDEILNSDANPVYVYNFTQPERECPPCHSSCEKGCWGLGEHNCQKFSKINCSPQCHQGRCFGPNPRECCHLFCAGGCTGPTNADCLACKNFYDGGVCKQECPPMMRYNPSKYIWEHNPNGRYAYGATCVKNCPDHLLRDSGACVRTCPANKKAGKNQECIPCDGPCPKNCVGVDVLHADNIDSFRGCTVIEGSITILDTSFEGYQEVYSNFTFGPLHGAMHPRKLNVFNTLKEVTGYISIQASHQDFKNLSFFRNLQIIGGRQLTEYFAALYVVKTSLESLNMRSLKSINSGNVAILENENLCFVHTINWQKVMKSTSHSALMQSNGKMCEAKNLTCHTECSSDGCWGRDANECLSCQSFKLDDTCIEKCDLKSGMYNAGKSQCKYCHEECVGQCFGPGNGNCSECRHVRDGPFCVKQCPDTKYADEGVCKPCHANCVDGCLGPENNINGNGCKSCEKAIVDPLDPNIVIQCLKADEPCPDAYYLEYIGPGLEEGVLRSLTGKSVCRKCHHLCKNCTTYGIHYTVCKCLHYLSSETCDDHCPRDHYPDQDNHICIKCAEECRGCKGPTANDCLACRNFRVYDAENSTLFNCTASCPFEKPHKVFLENDPYCSAEASNAIALHGSDDDNIPAFIGGIMGIFAILGIFLALVSYSWLQRARTKENTVKMTMRMSGFEDNEPLKPTNVKPNLAKLRIVKEAELRKGGILGYGAFGTVYKGVWVPEFENVKIPVAIKVLREGSTNKDFLEEAYIMASVDHPNLLKLLAVCMASELMLVTQLMPLGCLLDYVRNNKDKIGSKPLLNWCAQIARGMAYLEEHRMVHRDLALRNVLLQTPGCIKITDFGLAKLLDLNQEEYKAAGNYKVPIKWLALECIQHRVFTHKSDVWAFGVTVWELLSYGLRPYENIPAREVPFLLEKGERLPQPAICTIDVYMIMIKSWMLDAESRPSFKELADEFGKMAADPGRYLVIFGDKYMRLPSYTPQDEKELIRTLSMPIEGPEVIMDAEEYLQPKLDQASTESHPPPTPIKKFMDDRGFDGDPIHNSPNNSDEMNFNQNELKGNCHDNNIELDHICHSRDTSVSTRYCSDPLTSLERGDRDVFPPNNGIAPTNSKDVKVSLPVDDEDYLVPSPHSCNSTGYMDLVGDAKINTSVPPYVRNYNPARNVPQQAVDNLEYHLMNKNNSSSEPPAVTQKKPNTSDEDTDEHEYYNDYDGLQRELQPLNNHRNETTV